MVLVNSVCPSEPSTPASSSSNTIPIVSTSRNTLVETKETMRMSDAAFLEDFEIAMKVVIVGNGSVGKSSMIQRFCRGIFTRDYKKTIGVDFLERVLTIEDQSVRLMLWDTAGQEEFDAITRTYYRGANACVLACSVTDKDSFLALPKWKNKVCRECGDIPMVLVANKIDLQKQAVVDSSELESMARSLGISKLFRTSVKDDLHVNSVFTFLAQVYVQAALSPTPPPPEIQEEENEASKTTNKLGNELSLLRPNPLSAPTSAPSSSTSRIRSLFGFGKSSSEKMNNKLNKTNGHGNHEPLLNGKHPQTPTPVILKSATPIESSNNNNKSLFSSKNKASSPGTGNGFQNPNFILQQQSGKPTSNGSHPFTMLDPYHHHHAYYYRSNGHGHHNLNFTNFHHTNGRPYLTNGTNNGNPSSRWGGGGSDLPFRLDYAGNANGKLIKRNKSRDSSCSIL